MKRSLALVSFLLVAIGSLSAQTAPPPAPQLTWVRFYQVEPGHSGDYMKLMNMGSMAALDQLLADKKIVSWGMARPLTKSGQNWTDLIWITGQNWSAFDDLVGALQALDRSRSAEERQRYESMLGNTLDADGTRDVILRHLVQPSVPVAPTFKPAFIRVSYYTVKPGRNADVVALFKESTAQLYNDLVSRGVMGPWGLSTQEIVTSPDFTHMVWYFAKDLKSLDQVRDVMMARPEEVRTNLMTRVNELTEPHDFSSEILMITHLGGTPR
jgi:hypothetical protein